MSVKSPLKLVTGPSKILETPCRPDFCIPEWVIPEMFALLQKHCGSGLAAPQVGIDARFFITSWGMVYVNPIITWVGGQKVQTREGCLSFPGVFATMTRFSGVKMCGHDYSGMQAMVLQHELDHLDGRLITKKEAV